MRLRIIFLVLIFSTLIVGCSTKEIVKNSVLDKLEVGEVEDDILLVFGNQLDEETLNTITQLSYYTIDMRCNEYYTIIPVRNGSKVEVMKVEYKDNQLVETSVLFEEENSKDGFALNLQAYKNYGIPNIKVKVSHGDLEVNYLLVANVEETSKFELISIE